VVENLRVEYSEKMRERWNGSILRSVIPTEDFAMPSEDNIGDTHKKIAKNKRANDTGLDNQNLMDGVSLLPDTDQLKVEDLSLFGTGSAEIHPIIFEECYVKDADPRFVNLVKANPDILTEAALLAFDPATKASSQPTNFV